MIGEERALIQTPRERDKGNGTEFNGQVFYFISHYALVSSFLSYILQF